MPIDHSLNSLKKDGIWAVNFLNIVSHWMALASDSALSKSMSILVKITP